VPSVNRETIMPDTLSENPRSWRYSGQKDIATQGIILIFEGFFFWKGREGKKESEVMRRERENMYRIPFAPSFVFSSREARARKSSFRFARERKEEEEKTYRKLTRQSPAGRSRQRSGSS
jgi:hypothetical protein